MFYYKIDYLDEITEEINVEQGITSGATYSEAANELTQYYGEDNIISIYFSALDSVLNEDEILDMFIDEDYDE